MQTSQHWPFIAWLKNVKIKIWNLTSWVSTKLLKTTTLTYGVQYVHTVFKGSYKCAQLCSLAMAPLQIRFAVAVAFHRCCWHVDLVTSKFPWKFPPTVLYKIPPPTPPHPTKCLNVTHQLCYTRNMFIKLWSTTVGTELHLVYHLILR